ncbi:MAG TPA: EF-hand domain-containing protein [Luteimonas sp.]
MKNARTPLLAMLALGSALAMPLALAQSAVTPEVRAAEKAATQDASTQDGAATGSQPAGRQLGWNDVDSDGNGTISRTESEALPGLAAVFDQADADGDGELTADEYRSHAGKAGGEG